MSDRIRAIIGIVIGIVFLGIFLWDKNWSETYQALGEAKVVPLLLASVLMLAEWVCRGVRWWVLLRHVDKGARLWGMVEAIVIGTAINSVLPLRGGDLIRPAIVANERRLSYSLVMSTTVVERLFDAVAITAMVAGMLAMFPEELEAKNPVLGELRYWTWVFAGIGLAAIFATFSLLIPKVREQVERGIEWVPDRWQSIVSAAFSQVVLGLTAAGNPWRLLAGFILTAGVWGTGIGAAYCMFRAFDLDLGWNAAIFVEGALSMSVALPQAPGAAGVFQVVMEKTMLLFEAPLAIAGASALLFWAICYVPVTFWGLFLAYRRGIGIGSIFKKPDQPPV